MQESEIDHFKLVSSGLSINFADTPSRIDANKTVRIMLRVAIGKHDEKKLPKLLCQLVCDMGLFLADSSLS
jgi:hypothetical protein